MAAKEKSTANKTPGIRVKMHGSQFADPLKYKIESEKEIMLTPEKAYQFLEMESFEGERAVRERHVQFLFDEWQSGRFLWHNVILAGAKLGAKTYRINGQHTCWMRVNVPKDQEPLKDAKVMERIYVVETDEQLRNLYSAFDRAAPRTVGHISKVMLMGSDAARDIPPSHITKLVAGFKVFMFEDWVNNPYTSPNNIVALIEKNYGELFNLVGRFFGEHYQDTPYIRRAGVVAAMFATFERNVKGSDEFWGPVWTNIGLTSKTDPRWRLRQFIDSHTQSSDVKSIGSTAIVGTEVLYRVCINCWNRWRAGEEITSIRTTDKRVKARA